jgi:alpha 1,2-mannosyltransferase
MLSLILVCTVYFYWTPTTASSTVSLVPNTAFEVPLTERQKDFWKVLRPIFERHNPNCPSPDKLGDVNAQHFDPTKEMSRPDLTSLSEEDERKMEEAHASFVEDIKNSGKELKPIHPPGKRGVVSPAGANASPRGIYPTS